MLEALFNELNHQYFEGELPLPRLRWNGRLSSSAGRFCPGSRNPLLPRNPEIEIASYLRDLEDGYDHIRDTMLHEMIHYLLWHQRKPYGHTKEFNRILKRVGAKRWNTVPKERPVKYWYFCDGCQKHIPARRKFGVSACAACCKRYNNGQFHERFLLRPSGPPPPVPAAPKPVLAVSTAMGPEGARSNASSVTASTRPAAPAAPAALPASEIVRRLEELKNLILRTRK